MCKLLNVLLFCVLLASSCSHREVCLLETELFENYGGWIREDQFYDCMGSSYLMAHGKGFPVADASTTFTLPAQGVWHVWARTYNWNAPWDESQAPGLFSLIIDGVTLADSLGCAPSEWGWVKAGMIDVEHRKIDVALHDLTGFNGRCDAICFTRSENIAAEEIERQSKIVGHDDTYDLIVAGGGMAGLSAGVAASRLGLKALIVQDRPVLGGNSSVEAKITILGSICKPPYENMGRVTAEYGRPYKNPQRLDSLILTESGLDVLYSHRVIGAEVEDGKIKAVTAIDFNTGIQHVYKGRYFVDATGDGALGFLAGAEYMIGQETRDQYDEDLAPEKSAGLSYGSTLKWYAENDPDATSTFPVCPWAIQFDEDTVNDVMKSKWWWETGFYKDQIKDIEQIRDSWLRYIYGNWAYLKNNEPYKTKYAHSYLDFVATVLAKRESRRLRGDIVFSQNDILREEWRQYDDPAVLCSYPVDQHLPIGEFKSIQKHGHNPPGPLDAKIPGVNVNHPYMLPYRCLYSSNVDNLFMAGRDISVTRIALASSRVMGSTSMMGEAVAIAASLCVEKNCNPRDLYLNHLEELLAAFKKGTPARHDVVFNDIPF